MKKIIGTMRLPESHEEIVSWLKSAHKAGIDWIDTAWIYGKGVNEQKLGLALKELKAEGIEFKIQSKIWTSFFKETRKYFNAQLKALKIKKIDAMLLHRPSWNLNDDIKAWKTLIALQKAGKIGQIGVSNFEKDQILILEKETGVKPEINQIELSVSNFRDDRVFFAKKMNIEIQSWSSFGNDVKKNLNSKVVKKLAKKYKCSGGTILSSFLTSQGIEPIHASFNIDHLKETIKTKKLSKADIEELKSLNKYDNKFGEMYP